MTRVRFWRRILFIYAAQLGTSCAGKCAECYGVSADESLSKQWFAGIFRAQLAICGDSLCSDAMASGYVGFLQPAQRGRMMARSLVTDQFLPALYHSDHHGCHRGGGVFQCDPSCKWKNPASGNFPAHPGRELCRRSETLVWL